MEKVDVTKIRNKQVIWFKDYVAGFVSEELKTMPLDFTESDDVGKYIMDVMACNLHKFEATIYYLFRKYNTSWDIEAEAMLSLIVTCKSIKRVYHFVKWANPQTNQLIYANKVNEYLKQLKRQNKAVHNTAEFSEVINIFKR